jgi:hypothetical protein
MNAFTDINYIFNSIEHEDKSNSWKLEQLTKILNNLQKETYDNGKKEGFRQATEALKTYTLK